MKAIAEWLRRLADWCHKESLDPQVAVALGYVKWAETFAPGTSGEYKRAAVQGLLVKAFPSTPRHRLALALELAVQEMQHVA